jgi:hypothetical protein
MSTDIQHLRGEYSNGAVVGREGLVQLGHLSTNAGQLLHQMDPDTHIGKVQSRLHPRNSSSDNKDFLTHCGFPPKTKSLSHFMRFFLRLALAA